MEFKQKFFSSWIEIRFLGNKNEIDYESGQENVRLHESRGFVPQKFHMQMKEKEDSESSEDYDMGSEECKVK